MKQEKAKVILQLNARFIEQVKEIAELDNYKYNISENPKSVRPLIKSKAHFFSLPLVNDKIGAIVATSGEEHLVILNSSLSRGYEHFHLLHELYHIEHEASNSHFAEVTSTDSLYLSETSNPEDYKKMIIDRRASLYASLLLVNTEELLSKYGTFRKAYGNDVLKIACAVMEWFEAPFAMSLMRLYEENLITEDEFFQHIETDITLIKDTFTAIDLDQGVLRPSYSSSKETIEEIFVKFYESGSIPQAVVRQWAEHYALTVERYLIKEELHE